MFIYFFPFFWAFWRTFFFSSCDPELYIIHRHSRCKRNRTSRLSAIRSGLRLALLKPATLPVPPPPPDSLLYYCRSC